MRKIINNPEHVVDEMMEGYISAYSRYYVKHPDVNGVILKQRRKDKVALVIGGGSGHEPMFSGFVGKDLQMQRRAAIYLHPPIRTRFTRQRRQSSREKVFFLCMAAMREII